MPLHLKAKYHTTNLIFQIYFHLGILLCFASPTSLTPCILLTNTAGGDDLQHNNLAQCYNLKLGQSSILKS